MFTKSLRNITLPTRDSWSVHCRSFRWLSLYHFRHCHQATKYLSCLFSSRPTTRNSSRLKATFCFRELRLDIAFAQMLHRTYRLCQDLSFCLAMFSILCSVLSVYVDISFILALVFPSNVPVFVYFVFSPPVPTPRFRLFPG